MTTISTDYLRPFRWAILLVVAFLPIAAWAEVGALEVNGIAAKVNGRVITKNEVSFLLTPKWEKLKQQFPDGGEEFEKILAAERNAVIQELIDRHTTIDKFAHLGIEIVPKRIEEEIQREVRDNYQGNVNQLREALKASRMTLDSFRTLLGDRLLESEIEKRIQKDK